MQVILLKDVEKVGKEGDRIKVKDGFARNFLFPKKFAIPSTKGAVKIIEARRKKIARDAEKLKKSAEELARKIKQLSLTITAESGVDDALFGSITPEAIMKHLRAEGIQLDKKEITIKEPIKKLGIYNVEVKLHPEVKENLRVWVVKK